MRIGGFLHQSLIDYPGCISSVIFTQGCNFRCPFCHNGDLVQDILPDLINANIIEILVERNKLISSVVISGGEPLIQEGLIPFIEELKEREFKIKIDTNGYEYETLEDLIDNKLIDYVAMDIKAPAKKYDQTCGGIKLNINNIYGSIGTLLGSDDGISYEFRTTVLPEFNEDDIRSLGRMTKGAQKYVLQGFRNLKTLDPSWQLKESVTEQTLKKFKTILEEYIKTVEISI